MEWGAEQVRAIDAVGRWLKDPGDKQVFRLWGFAGTGKSTVAAHLASLSNGQVLFASYTGKAAYVMRQKGCEGATTLHSLIYHPVEKNCDRLRELERRLATAEDATAAPDPEFIDELESEIAEEKAILRRPSWGKNEESPLRQASLLIVDECSMVDDWLGQDIISFGTPILVLGDPAQLPPVRGSGFFTSAEPDVLLTNIHRQARDNPIIAMATLVRQGQPLPFGSYGESRVIPRDAFDRDAIALDTQIIVGRNATRRRANANRRVARGFPPEQPVAGDRLVCLRNNHEEGLLNGSIWYAMDACQVEDSFVDLVIRDDDQQLGVRAHMAPFLGQEIPFWDAREAEAFDFGYALTCHKSQGSQWDDVLVVDESQCFGANATRWVYTALTRAAERVTVVR